MCFFRNFVIITSWKRAWSFTWTNLNALHPRMHCCKFGWNWAGDSGEEDFLNAVNVISLFCNYLPFGKGNGPLFDQKWIPFYQGCIMPSLLKIGPVVLEKKSKIGQVYRQTDRQTNGQTDDRQSEKLTWAFSSGELRKRNCTSKVRPFFLYNTNRN